LPLLDYRQGSMRRFGIRALSGSVPDVALAALLTALNVLSSGWQATAVGVAVVETAPVALRRRTPLAALAANHIPRSWGPGPFGIKIEAERIVVPQAAPVLPRPRANARLTGSWTGNERAGRIPDMDSPLRPLSGRGMRPVRAAKMLEHS